MSHQNTSYQLEPQNSNSYLWDGQIIVNLSSSLHLIVIFSFRCQTKLVQSHPGQLPAVEGQGGGFEEKQPSSEEHKHVRCLHITSLFANVLPKKYIRVDRIGGQSR